MNPEDNKKIFENYLTNHYSSCDATDFSKENLVFELLCKNKKVIEHNLGELFNRKVDKKNNILDLGCGYGSFLFFLQANGYQNVTGVDLSSEEINICKQYFKSYDLYQDDIINFIKNTPDKFDVIYLSHVLEHIKKENLFSFIEDIKRVMSDNGIFIIIVPNSAAYFNAAANRYGDLTHEIGFTNLSLSQLLMVANFKKIDMRNFTGSANLLVVAIRNFALSLFGFFMKILGYDKQDIYTPSILVIAEK